MQAKAWYFSRKTWKTQNSLGKLKLVFSHELSWINHEWLARGWCLAEKRGSFIALRIENPYNSLRQIANLPQRRYKFVCKKMKDYDIIRHMGYSLLY